MAQQGGQQLSFYSFLLGSRNLLPQLVHPFSNCWTPGLFPIFGNYEYSRCKRLSFLGLSSVLGSKNRALGRLFLNFSAPLSSCGKQTMFWICCRSQICFSAGSGTQWNFCLSPGGLRLLHERRIGGCRWDFVPIPRGSFSLSVHLWNRGVSLSAQHPWPHTFWWAQSRGHTMGKSLWV